MKLYRITAAPYSNALDGMGASLRQSGGRWNASGVPMIYASESRALAFAEVMAHFKGLKRFPVNHDLVAYLVKGTKGIRRLVPSKLPADWNLPGPPFPRITQALGSAFISSNDLLMRVTSVIIPHEWNYLINPNAIPGRLSIESIEPFRLDPRFNIFIGGQLQRPGP
jgi:RES domain-containing protein